MADYYAKLNEELLYKLSLWNSEERKQQPYQYQIQLLREIRYLQVLKTRHENEVFRQSLED